MDNITLTIDNQKITAAKGMSVLKAAQSADIYIPSLCSHPDLSPSHDVKSSEFIYRGSQKFLNTDKDKKFDGCRLCLVQLEGRKEVLTACDTPVAQGMVVHTGTPEVQKLRQQNLSLILKNHPHACLLCAQKEGCAREPCSMKVPVPERCCVKLGRCEIEQVADYIGIPHDLPRYTPKGFPLIKDEPLFQRDYDLCINCTRCLRVCREVRGIDALGMVFHNGEAIVGPRGPTLKESGCKFCGACVEVCPTGTLLDLEPSFIDREKVLVPCKHACPAEIDVPRYVRLAAEGKWSEATAVVRETVPLPNILGHICSHPCETACRRGKVNEPIAICALKRIAAENDTGLWQKSVKMAPATGKKVAIVGAGPAGLTAAYYLTRLGHKTTVFDSLSDPGGMLQVGIPRYRLPREIIKKDLDEIVKLGVEVKLNTSLGTESTPEKLKQQGYDAVFLATGTHRSRALNIEGENLEGVYQGVYFLKDAALGKLPQNLFQGKTVAVIGGGNVAIDAARTALRLGARKVQLNCLESSDEMPAHEWEIQQAVEEGAILNCCWGPQRFTGNGKVSGIEFIACTAVFDAQRRFAPAYNKEAGMSLAADAVIVAIGQASDLPFLPQGGRIETTRGGSIKIDAASLQTGIAGVFAGGDVASGPASVIEAVAAGRKAAIAIDKYLGGQGNIQETLVAVEKPNPWLGREEDFAARSRVPMPNLALQQRITDFAEVELGFDHKQAIEEAQRCLRCDLRLTISAVPRPPEKWLEFTPENVAAAPDKEGVFRLLDKEKNVVLIAGRASLQQGLQENLNADKSTPTGSACYFIYEEDPLYTARESELIQQYLQQHGSMPPGNEDALF